MPQSPQNREQEDTAEERYRAKLEAARLPHIQDETRPPDNIYPFTTCQFVAYVGDLKINRRGDVVLNLVVPHRYRHLALPMADAYGIPLSLDVQRWKVADVARGLGAARDDRSA